MNRKNARLSYSLMLAASMLCATPVAMAAPAAVPQARQQNKGVSGQVFDENGEPIIGASVLVEGTTTGTVTDLDGNFEIPNAAPGAKLQISFVGYATKHLSAAPRKMSIMLEPDTEMLEETVVIGYGVQKKSNVTGAISSVKADDFKNNVNTNAAQSLQGKVSGVQVVNASGAPGSAPSIRVRGYSSNGKSDPLYIVDGLKVTDISYLDPSSIQSMEILKDAASAAIYGAEAGNGVVLITTNSGKKGSTKITFDASWSFQNLAHKTEMMNGPEYKEFMTEAYGDGFTELYNKFCVPNVDTDWQDVMYETGTMQKYNVGLQGGNDNGKLFANIGYMDNNGMLVKDTDYYKRISGQINASYKLKPWLEFASSNSIAYIRSNGVTEGNKEYGYMKGILNMDPITPIFYESLSQAPDVFQQAVANGLNVNHDGDRYYAPSYFSDANPLSSLTADPSDSKVKGNTSFFINGMTSINLTPFKGFVFTSRLGYTLSNLTKKSAEVAKWFKLSSSPTVEHEDPDYSVSQTSQRYFQWENFFNYNIETAFGNWELMGGMSYSDRSTDYLKAATNKLSNTADNFQYLDYSTLDADDQISGNLTQQRQIAYYGRLSWDWNDRYQAQFNFRADSYDAAYLDLDHNWGFFPSASVGWTFSQEEFMKDVAESGILTYGKFRASYGVNGSISNLGDYMYAASMRTGTIAGMPMTYAIDGTLYQATYPNTVLANPDLRWERSKQFDLGLDLRFYRDRLTTAFDYYHKVTDGLLVQSTAQLITGCSTIYQNLGKVLNQGFEAEIEWRDKVGKDFSYSIKANFATNKNNVEEYKGEGVRIAGSQIMGAGSETYFEEGYPIWYILGYKMTGVNSETGEAIYYDKNGDGDITEDDRVNLGNAIPDFTYGLTLSSSYKGFDLSVYGAGSHGSKLVYALYSANAKYDNRPHFLSEDRWQKAGDVASMPSALQQLVDKKFFNSDAFVRDASFFRIKQIQLGYNLPKSLLKKIHIENVRIYGSLENFFTFTSYEGADPEANALSNSKGYDASSMALDYGSYPSAKTVSFGLNVAF